MTEQSSDGTEPLIQHWDGVTWTVVEPADPGSRQASLSAVAAVGPEDVWAAGDGHLIGPPLVEHWDGERWSRVPIPPLAPGLSPGTGDLAAIEPISPTDVWALGYYWANDPVEGRTTSRDSFLHWDGRSWEVVPSPRDESTDGMSAMQDVSAVATDDVWAVGSRVDGFSEVGTAGGALVEHWDGQSWKLVEAPPGETPLTRVAALANDDVWAVRGGEFRAVGYYGFGPAEVVHWDGTSWTTSLTLSGQDESELTEITDITAVGPTDVWVVGIKEGRPLILRWNGREWKEPDSVDPSSFPRSYAWLSSVSHTDDGTVVAFGGQSGAELPAENRMWFRCGAD